MLSDVDKLKRENDRLKLVNYQLKAKCVSQRASTAALRETLNGAWPRWWNRKTLNSPPPIEAKIATIYRPAICENDIKTSRKDFPQLKS